MTREWKIFFLLILILIVASFLRLYSLNSLPPGLYSDEAMNGNNAVQALEAAPPIGGFKVFYTENNGREGLFMNIQALFLKIFSPTKPWVLRLPSAIFGILTVLGVYFLTKELFNVGRSDLPNIDGNQRRSDLKKLNYFALFAAFLLATSFWHINFSRIGFRAIMAPAFLTWGLYLLLLSFRKVASLQKSLSEKSQIPNPKSQTNHKFKIPNVCNLVLGAWCLPVLAGLVYGLGMHSYIAYRATPLLIVFSLWLLGIRHGSRRTLKIGAIFIAAAIIVFLPLGFYFLENPPDFFGRTSQISIFTSATPFKDLGLNILKTAGMFNIAGDWNPRHNIPGAPLLFWPVGILFLIGLFFGIWNLFRNSKLEIRNFGDTTKFAIIILLGWLVVTAIPVILSSEGMPHALRAILMAPPVFILAAVGGVWLYGFIVKELKTPNWLPKTAVFLFFIFLTLQVTGSYFISWAKNPEVARAFNQEFVQIGRELNALSQELPKYVVIDTGGHDVREIGTPAQTIMYITDTFLPEKQKEKNIYYIQPSQISEIPENNFIIELQ